MNRKLSSEEYRRKLEHQIYMAQEHPARIYDLTDCNLSQIPRGVFSFCKVLRKYSLNLSENRINSLESGGNLDDLSLLGELIVTKNKFKQLSFSFTKLCNLQKLMMDDNDLVKFPTILVELVNLKILSLEGNSIKIIPKEVRNFKSLRYLNLSRNPVNIVFPEICEVESLEELYMDIDDIKNVSPDILSLGINSLWSYFCQVKNRKYKEINSKRGPLTNKKDTESNQLSYSNFTQPNQCNVRYQDMDEQVLEHERKLSILEIEDKRKNVDLIKLKSELEEEAIKAILKKKKHETDKLYDRVKYEELSSKELIESIFDFNHKSKKREQLENKISSIPIDYGVKLSEDERESVLDSMKNAINRAAEAHQGNHMFTDMTFSNDHDDLSGSKILPLESVNQLKETEKQKLAFQQFQLEKDSQIKRLQESICLVELKLQQLSVQEMKHPHILDNDIFSRSNLMSLLHNLRNELNQRKKELGDKIEAMDNSRDRSQTNFWIIQYQTLLDEKTKSDCETEELLRLANFDQWATTLIRNGYSFESILTMSEGDLVKMELGNESERKRFLLFINEWKFNPIKSSIGSEASAPSELYASDGKSSALDTLPSAPLLEHSLSDQSAVNDETSVVLARKETECCICLNVEARILLLNCGHVCCCKQCSLTVRQCPLCRQKVVQRVNLEF